MKITVIVPTYRRSQDLARCLQALKQQSRLPEEVLIVIRDTDRETQHFLREFKADCLPIQVLSVKQVGVVAAMNAGLAHAQGDIIAFTDDDAAPRTHWLKQLENHFIHDERVGGVGGRDCLYSGGKLITGQRKVVGKVQWFGRVIGNHHLGVDQQREVDVLKGVNMSFRRQAMGGMRFDERMRGSGAQVHFELVFCLALRRAGWKLIYDPNIVVDHYSAQRFDEDQRHQYNAIAFRNEVHNQTLALLEYLSPWQRIIFFLWVIVIGTRKSFGMVQWFRFLPWEGNLATQKWLVSLQGLRLGWQTWKHSHQLIED